MMNPAKLLAFRKQWGEFEQRHPKFVMFLGAVIKNGVGEGSIIEMKITLPDGRVMESNMKVSAEDMEMLKTVGELGPGMM